MKSKNVRPKFKWEAGKRSQPSEPDEYVKTIIINVQGLIGKQEWVNREGISAKKWKFKYHIEIVHI